MSSQSVWEVSKSALESFVYPRCKKYDQSGLPLDILIFTTKFLYVVKKSIRDQASTTYVNGKKHGECKKYWDNGNIKFSCSYHNEEKHGVCKIWRMNGTLHYHDMFVNGEEHGECREWDFNGKLVFHGRYINGEKYEYPIGCTNCNNNKINTALYPCGHMLFCDICVLTISECPRCSVHIKDIVKLLR